MVVALQANYLEVELDVAPDGCPGRLLCTRRTRLSHRGEAVYVGDRVRVEAIDPGQGRAVVAEVEPRHSFLTRPPVANVSLVAVVLAVEQPSFDPDQASRFLLTAERTGLEVILLLTKTDLLSAAALERLVTRLQGWGYDPLALSSAAGMGIDALRKRLAGAQLSVLCGPSGVGKSSLLNQLCPDLQLRTAAVCPVDCSAGATPPATWSCFPWDPTQGWLTPPASTAPIFRRIPRNWGYFFRSCGNNSIPGPVASATACIAVSPVAVCPLTGNAMRFTRPR